MSGVSKANPPPLRGYGDRLRLALAQIPYYHKIWQLIWDATGSRALIWLMLLTAQGLLPVVSVYLSRSLVDSLTGALGTGFSIETARPVIVYASLIAFAMILSEAAQAALSWVRVFQSEAIQDHIAGLIHQKSSQVDLAFYDSPEYYDHLHRARSDAGARSLAFMEASGSLIQNAITLIAMAGILTPYGIWIPLLLFVSTLPALLVALTHNQRYHRWWEATTTDRRWAQYYDLLLTSGAVAPELRLFNLGPHFQALYQNIRQKLRLEHLDLQRRQNLAGALAGTIALLAAAFSMAWMVWRAFMGTASLGDLVLFYQAFNRGQSLLRTLLGNVSNIYANSLFLSNLFAFLDLEPRIAAPPRPATPPTPLTQGISVRSLSFRYPGSDQFVLNGLNLFFPAGQIVSIVGPNGAGKSTLLKLLCRFYDPETGAIELDGVDLRQFDPEELRRLITVMFQLPVPYYATAGDNIAFGNLPANPTPKDVEVAARAAGAHTLIQRLSRGYETLLGKLFAGGEELSVGEWQRVALARTFLRQAPIILLDEPTSFMDSWAEFDWMQRFRQIAKGRTALIITHRFTTARHADLIYVMSQGQVVEAGNHADLLNQGGLYAQSWQTQIQGQAEITPQSP